MNANHVVSLELSKKLKEVGFNEARELCKQALLKAHKEE